MISSLEKLLGDIKQQFPSAVLDSKIASDQATIELLPENILVVCQALKDDYGFEQLVDLCGVDYSAFGKADWETQSASSTGFSRGVSETEATATDSDGGFAVVYHLLSVQHNQRLRVRCMLNNIPPKIDSVTNIWNSANWYEREAFDLFGILFDGHSDLRRILTDYGFIGHPLRKDFPLQGNVEVIYNAEKKRVVYQPVTISNRVLVPRVIRQDKQENTNQSKPSNA